MRGRAHAKAARKRRGPRDHGAMQRSVFAFVAIQRLPHKPGRTGICSARTDFSASGSMLSAWRIVGATCEVSTGVFNTTLGKRGLETISPTLVSPKLIPPCSAFFLLDPVYVG